MSESVIEFPDKPPSQPAKPELPLMVVEVGLADGMRRITGDKFEVIELDVLYEYESEYEAFKTSKPLNVVMIPTNHPSTVREFFKRGNAVRKIFKTVKVIDVTGQPANFGPQQMIEESWDLDKLVLWAKPRAKVLEWKLDVAVSGDAQPPQESHTLIWEQCGLIMDKQGWPRVNLDNGVRILEHRDDLKGLFWYDEFLRDICTTWGCQGKPYASRRLVDHDYRAMTLLFQRELGLWKFSTNLVREVIETQAGLDVRNEAKERLLETPWDGKARLDRWMVDCLGCPDTPYHHAVGKNLFIALAARIMRPGELVKGMVILEGLQDAYKSQIAEVIADPWFCVKPAHPFGHVEFLKAMQGKLLMEIPELTDFTEANVDALKACLSTRVDRFRRSYGHVDEDFPRTCLFIGTTNKHNYLFDTTGNVRFFPVRCSAIKIDLLRQIRQQFYAEALVRFQNGENWWTVPKDEAESIRSDREVHDPWEAIIQDYLKDNITVEITTLTLATKAIGLPDNKSDKKSEMRIGSVMRYIGWQNKRLKDETGSRHNTWIKNDGLPEAPPF